VAMRAVPEAERYHAIDYVKAAAIVAVVFTHAGRIGATARGAFWDVALTEAWTRYHVPSFLICSGFLYVRARPASLQAVGRRLRRVLVPYLVASIVVQLAGFGGASSLGAFAKRIATASMLGPYYYVLIIFACVLLIWPLSRAPRAAAWTLLGVAVSLAIAFGLEPSLRPLKPLFWTLRDPLDHFYLGYFCIGWLAAAHTPQLRMWLTGHRRLAWALCGTSFGVGIYYVAQRRVFEIGVADTVLYTLGVVGIITLATAARPAGSVVRFLADSSFSIYLYHHLFQLMAAPITREWPGAIRIGTQVLIGLGVASLLVLAGRRTLGRSRSRFWLGA
jgi:peptidoglycan/LPS O-acetylase OafA/YrhL